MRGVGFILALIVVIGSLFLASGVYTYYAEHSYWDNHKAGFTTGVIHGVIAPIMLIVGILKDYGIYEINNKGWFYDFGFVLGIMLAWAGGSGGTKNVIKNYYSSARDMQDKNPLKKIKEKIEGVVSKKNPENSEPLEEKKAKKK
ncbi:MAG: hypothetical protein WC533_04980 [Candidatus Pacearchaeota archaeon]